jgi:hypothetical protein
VLSWKNKKKKDKYKQPKKGTERTVRSGKKGTSSMSETGCLLFFFFCKNKKKTKRGKRKKIKNVVETDSPPSKKTRHFLPAPARKKNKYKTKNPSEP